MRLVRWAPALAILVAAVVAGFVLLDDEDQPDPVEIESSASLFDSLDELVAASDVVVVATVTRVEDGRTITSPGDPDAGIRTRLVRLDVSATLAGDEGDGIVVEEAATFADGTPIVLDGMTELTEGDAAIWFLVAGGSEEMPYLAVVNAQGRYTIRADTLESAGLDALSQELARLGPDGLAGAIRATG